MLFRSLLGQHRQRAAHKLGDHDGAQHGGADREGLQRSDPVQHHQPAVVGDGQRCAAQERHAEFLPDDPEDVLEFQLTQGQCADDRDGGLAAGVAAGVHQHRDAG